MNRRLASIQVSDERLQAAFVLKDFGFLVALVDQLDPYTGIQERQFAQSLRQRVVVERDVSEYLRTRLEAQRGPTLARVTDGNQRRLRLAQAVFLAMQFSVTTYVQLEEI